MTWVIGEGHRRAREQIVSRLEGLLFHGTVEPDLRQPLLDAYRAIAGDTHLLVVDEGAREVWEGQIDRSGRRLLH